MAVLIGRIVRAAHRRRGVVLAAVLVLVAVSAAGARRLSFDTDVLSLLPRDGRVIPAFREFLGTFGNMDQLYVLFTAPEGHGIGDYAEAIDGWIDELRSAPEIVRVDAGIADRSRDFGWLADRQLLLLRGTALDEALNRLRPDGLQAAVAARRELLTVPSPEVAALVRQDPAGLSEIVAAAVGGTEAGLNFASAAQGYVSGDGRRRLVIAQPARPPYDADFSRALDARLRRIQTATRAADEARAADADEPLPPLGVDFAGGHRIALETEAVVRREGIFNLVGSLALILPLLFLVFRSLWLVGVGSLPSALSLLIVLGLLGFSGRTLSAAATGSAAMLFGLGVDGVVLLYVAYRLAATSGGSTDAVAAIEGPSSSMLLGMWTTAATFYGLTFVDFPSLQQLGLLIGHSMLVCGALTLVIVPALLPRRPPRRAAPTLVLPGLAAWIRQRRRAIVAASIVATVVLGAAATRVRINPTLDRLRSVTPSALLEEQIAPLFGLPRDVYVVLARGDSLEPLLVQSEQLEQRLSTEAPAVRVHAPTRLLPSAAAQERAAAHIRNSGLAPAAVNASLAAAADRAGFRPGAFDPFADRLPTLLNAEERLTFEGYAAHGLGDLVARFVRRSGDERGWLLATYVYPTTPAEVDAVQSAVTAVDARLEFTGLPLVNRELADRFLPQFVKGLAIGTAIVVALVVLAFRNVRLSLLGLTPTAIGLVWAAGLLGLARVELDLFAVFAVVTFVGIGVDYGIHLVHRYQERGGAQQAVAELAPVILSAAAITMLGYGTLLTSSYPPLRSIGLVSAVSVVALAAASVLFLPALLMAPPGRDA